MNWSKLSEARRQSAIENAFRRQREGRQQQQAGTRNTLAQQREDRLQQQAAKLSPTETATRVHQNAVREIQQSINNTLGRTFQWHRGRDKALNERITRHAVWTVTDDILRQGGGLGLSLKQVDDIIKGIHRAFGIAQPTK